jgi:hypothetical protein
MGIVVSELGRMEAWILSNGGPLILWNLFLITAMETKLA